VGREPFELNSTTMGERDSVILCVRKPIWRPTESPDRIIYHRSEMIALMCFCLRPFTYPQVEKPV
jgi:hypothetical protein